MSFDWNPISEQEIRLLRRRNSTVSGELSYDLHVCVYDAAPPYAAISYMCGPPPDNEVIYVNGRRVHVRRNCRDALQQVQQYDNEHRYLWLDCVCINQVDLDEKSRQVQSMGRIYRRADVVLACIGFGSEVPPVDSLKEAESVLIKVSGFDDPRKMISTHREHSAWLDTLFPRQLKTLIGELNALGALPYWERLWIIQEIHLGKTIKLLVGHTCLEWRAVVALYANIQRRADMERGSLRDNFAAAMDLRHTAPGPDERLHFGGFNNLVGNEEWRKDEIYSLDDALETFKTAKCSLPHDRIYGLRDLIKWPQTLGAITPDYHLDPFELAQESLRYLRAEECELDGFENRSALEVATTLLDALGVDLSNVLVSQRLCELNTALQIPSEIAALSDATEHQRRYHGGSRRCAQHHPSVVRQPEVLKLSCDDRGRFVTALTDVGQEHGPFSILGQKCHANSDTSGDDRDQPLSTLTPLHCGDTVVGWLPPHARSGDYLASIWRDEAEPGLILRPVSSNPTIFQVVGIFMLQRGATIGGHSPLSEHEELILHFDSTDLLLFAVQYCRHDDDDASQAQIARTFLERYGSRVARTPFSSFAVLHRKPKPTGNAYRWSNEHGFI